MVHLQNLHEKYKSKGLLVFTISVFPDLENLQQMTKDMGITYPVFIGSEAELSKRYAYG